MDALKWISVAILCIGAVYLIARLGSTAYFNSKHDYESRTRNVNKEDS